MNLTGNVILITGAAGGLGSALAQACARAGADLVLLDKNRHRLGQLSDEFELSGLTTPGLYPMDLAGAGPDDFRELAAVLQSEYGGLNALVHCALDFDGLRPLEQIEPQDWLRSLQVNVNAPWLMSSVLLPLLKGAGNGRLFFILDDLENAMGAYFGAYGASKAALTALVRQFAAELENTQVAVRGILPGAMRTGFRAKVYHAENPSTQPLPVVAAEKIAGMLANPEQGDLVVDISG